MRTIITQSILYILLLSITTIVHSQVYNLNITINNGQSTTTCTDPFGTPDPLWGVNIDNQGWNYFPDQGGCFNALPYEQFIDTYTCPSQVPTQVEICFKALENDHLLAIFCEVDNNCEEVICQDFTIPAINTPSTDMLALPSGGDAEGSVEFTITLQGPDIPNNDMICDAVDLGTLDFGVTLGDATQPLYSNLCATTLNEPVSNSSIYNEGAVWFTFNSGPNPSGEIIIVANNLPFPGVPDIDLEMAVFTSDSGDCTGNLDYMWYEHDDTGFDHILNLYCPMPNTNYYIMVDGVAATKGVFGLEVIDIGVLEGGDLRCDFDDLGQVPDDGMVMSDWRSNFCATDSDDPYIAAFISQNSVWFGFEAPNSGHVLIEGITDTLVDSIGIQLAVYRTFNNLCTGPYGHVTSEYDDSELNQSIDLDCLTPGRSYWVLVDGTGFNTRGVFKVRVSDAGDTRPKTYIDTTICAGEVFEVGNSDYTESGMYENEISLGGGCDSLVFTTLTVLDSIEVSITQTSPAVNQTPTGHAVATVTGGSGNYTYLWCNGETTAMPTMLVGGTNCCVTITDDVGCEGVACLDVEFVEGIYPTYTTTDVLCNGENTGQVSLTATSGIPPYTVNWAGPTTGMSTIAMDGDQITITDLTAGDYTFTVADANIDTMFLVTITEPSAIDITLANIESASCFGVCDGSVEVAVTGGVGGYTYTWSNGSATAQLMDLCSNEYGLTVTDANGCSDSISIFINQPPEFIATIDVVDEVSCFGESDGILSVSTQNGTGVTYTWTNGAMGQNPTNLMAGTYSLTVVNEDGCIAQTSVDLPQPSAPFEVELVQTNDILCFGDETASLQAQTTGPATQITYTWTTPNGENEVANNLGAATYVVTVTNERGCTDTDDITIGQPTAIETLTTTTDITCLTLGDNGSIVVDSTWGGQPPYVYSVDGNFTTTTQFGGLASGAYDVTIQDSEGCELTLPLTVQPAPEVLLDLGDDFTIHLGETAILEAIAVGGNDFVYTWQPVDSLTTAQIEVTPLVSTAYTVSVYDTLTHCTATDNIFVYVDDERRIYIPNAFSPNGDGINDLFFINSGEIRETIHYLRIFGRDGSLVYNQEDMVANDGSRGWDGTFNGQKMNNGVYVYVTEIEFLDGTKKVYSGEVNLIR